MDPRTLELLRVLQSGPYDDATLASIWALVRGQRTLLAERKDLGTLAEISELLEGWAQSAGAAPCGARALIYAADIAERELQQASRSAQLQRQAQAAAANGGEDAEAAQAEVLALMGELRSEAGDLDAAIDAYEQALDADANMDAIGRLAELFTRRKGEGDAEQAADLYCTLGEALGNPEGIPMLERALDQNANHAEASALLEQYLSARVLRARSGRTVVGFKLEKDPDAEQPLATLDGTRIPPASTPPPAASQPPPAAAPRPSARPMPIDVVARSLMPASASQSSVPPANAAWPAAPQRGSWPAAAPQRSSSPAAAPQRSSSPAAAPQRSSPPAAAPQRSSSPAAAPQRGSWPAAAPQRSSSPAAARISVPSAAQRLSTAPAAALAPAAVSVAAFAAPAPQAQAAPVFVAAPQPQAAPAPFDDDEPVAPKARWALPGKPWLIGGALLISSVVAALALKTPDQKPASSPSTSAAAAGARVDAPTPVPVPPAPPAQAPAPTPVAAPTEAPLAAAAVSGKVAAPAVAEKPKRKSPAVHADIKAATVRGGKLSDDALAGALAKATPKLERCYAQALKKKPRTEGRMLLGWTVRTTGKAVAIKKLGGTIKDTTLYRCTALVISGTRFPRPAKKAAQVKLPLDYAME